MPTVRVQPPTSFAYRVWEQRWAVAIVTLVTGAVTLTATVRYSKLLPGEASVTRWLWEDTGGFIQSIATVFDFTIDNTTAPILFIVLTLTVWRAWGRYATLLFLAMGGFSMAIRVVEIANRPRPDETFVWKETFDGTSGYPSGHVIYAVLVFGALAYLALQHMGPSWGRTALVGFLAAIIVLMGIMRVVELDHWPADVIASYLIALPLLVGGIWLYPRLLSWLRERIPWVFSILTTEKERD